MKNLLLIRKIETKKEDCLAKYSGSVTTWEPLHFL